MRDLIAAWEAHPEAGWAIFIVLAIIALKWVEKKNE